MPDKDWEICFSKFDKAAIKRARYKLLVISLRAKAGSTKLIRAVKGRVPVMLRRSDQRSMPEASALLKCRRGVKYLLVLAS